MPSTPLETDLLARVDRDRLMRETETIAAWERYSGEPDERASFEWLEARLREAGYATELTEHPAYISLPGPARAEVDGQAPIEGISHAFATATPDGGLRARLVDGADPDVDPRGAIVLLDGLANGGTALDWQARGSVGQIHVHDDHLHETSVSPVWGNPDEDGLAAMPATPGMSIRRADGARLRDALARGPVEIVLNTDVLTEWRPIPLLIGDLSGAPDAPYVLLSSHVDSWYFGAMDNGSANATTLEVARLVAERAGELRRGLKVAFWSGHSHGRFAGSAWFADRYWRELDEGCAAHVFVDSTGGIDATVITEAPVMPQTLGLATDVVADLTGEAFEGKRIGRFADQSFYAIGVNAIFGTLSEQDAANTVGGISFKTGGRRAGGLGWWWHTPDDTIDKVDPANLERDTRIYLATVVRLLHDARLPFDYRPAVREIEDALSARAARAGDRFDAAPLLAEVAELRGAIDALHAALDATDPGADPTADPTVDATLIRLARHLVPVAFHRNGRFGRDPAGAMAPVPALADLDRLADADPADPTTPALATRLLRASNWVRHEIRAATRVARAHLDDTRA